MSINRCMALLVEDLRANDVPVPVQVLLEDCTDPVGLPPWIGNRHQQGSR